MNKYLMLSAAAVLASSASAYAGTHSFTFGTSGGGSYCDGGTVVTGTTGGGKGVDAWKHTNNNCYSGTSEGQGLVGKTKTAAVKGKLASMSDTYMAKNYQIYSEQLNYTLPGKVKSGAEWTLWVGLNGTSSFEGNSGVLNNVDAASHGKGHTSTASVVKQLIKQHQGQKN